MIPINAFPYRLAGRKLLPKYVTFLGESGIRRAIGFFENSLGKTIHEEEIIEALKSIFPKESDTRLIYLLYHSLRVFYGLKIPNDSVIINLKRKGINDEWELRLRFYRWVQKHYGGFLSLEERDDAISKFCGELGLEPEILNKALMGEILSGSKIYRRIGRKPEVQEVIGVANYLLLEKALALSEDAEIILRRIIPKGALLKEVLFRAKKFRILVDFVVNGEDLKISLSGPYTLFKHPSPIYGEGISRSIVFALAQHNDWSLRAKIKIRNKIFFLSITRPNPHLEKVIPPYTYHKEIQNPQYDSTLEAKIHFLLKRLFPNAKITRETEIIRAGNYLVIPDFTLETKNKKIFIEVVGFWTPQYATKKKEKLEKLHKEGIPILAIVDTKLKKHFKNTKIPAIIWDQRNIKARTLKNIIQKLLDTSN